MSTQLTSSVKKKTTSREPTSKPMANTGSKYDAAIQLVGKPVKIKTRSGTILAKKLKAIHTYQIVVVTAEDKELVIYKHAIDYLEEADPA